MKTVYRHCTILSGREDMTAEKDMAVVVEDGKIAAIVPDAQAPQDGKVTDLGGRYLMPGLINLHVHLPAGGKPKKKQTDNNKLVKLILSNALTREVGVQLGTGFAKTELMSGVTTLRAVGGVSNFDSILRDRIDAGKAVGPRILAANSAIGTPGGHMVGSVAVGAESLDEAMALVRQRAEEGVDLIKLMITGGVLDAKVKGEPGVMKMPPEYVKACCDEAHKLGLQVAAHVESPEGVRVAIENGVDTIEHGAKMSEHEIELFQKNGAAYICTLSPAFPLARFDRAVTGISEMVQYNSEVVLDGCIEGAKAALQNGIPVGLGTDTGCPYITHYDMWRELYHFVKLAGVTPTFALHTATLKNAQIAGVADETGSIEVGKSADFLITDGDPLADFQTMRKPYMVVFRGKQYLQPKIKKYEECERELDRYML